MRVYKVGFDLNKWDGCGVDPRRFVAVIPERIRILARAVQTTPGFEAWTPDLTPESLLPLGQWLSRVVRTTTSSEPEIGKLFAESPKWVHLWIRDWDLTDETFSICCDIGMYLSQMLIARIPDLSWGIGKTALNRNQPAVRGIGKVDFNGP